MESLPLLRRSLPVPPAFQTKLYVTRVLPPRPLRMRASSSGSGGMAQNVKVIEEEKDQAVNLLACPICFKPLQSEDRLNSRQFKCGSCKRVYPRNKTYIDLTITAGMRNYEEPMPPYTEVFRNPLISYVYERGYRQLFHILGFPGPDEELKLANKYLESVAGGVLVDVSCATGVSTRRFIKSGLYSTVIGLDFSENMLEQFQVFVQQDPLLKKLSPTLVRADVGRLPFATGTVDAVHAGAAVHCWSSPSNGVAEISRILKPGGIFVATTNVTNLISPIRRALRIGGGQGMWTEEELEELCKSCGLINWSRIRSSVFIMFSTQKPL